MIQMSVFMLVLFYICGKLWTRCKERWECYWPYSCCRNNSNTGGESDDVDVEGGEVLCYLCNRKVPASEWNSLDTGHRVYCAMRCKENRGEILLNIFIKIT